MIIKIKLNHKIWIIIPSAYVNNFKNFQRELNKSLTMPLIIQVLLVGLLNYIRDECIKMRLLSRATIHVIQFTCSSGGRKWRANVKIRSLNDTRCYKSIVPLMRHIRSWRTGGSPSPPRDPARTRPRSPLALCDGPKPGPTPGTGYIIVSLSENNRNNLRFSSQEYNNELFVFRSKSRFFQFYSKEI